MTGRFTPSILLSGVALLALVATARAAGPDGVVTPFGVTLPPALFTAGIADPAGDRVLLSGAQLWQLPLAAPATFALAPTAGETPPERREPVFARDDVHRRFFLLGGRVAANPTVLADMELWCLNTDGGLRWRRVTVSGPLPPRRYLHSLVYDSRRNRLLLYGGVGESGTLGDVWTCSLDAAAEAGTWAQEFPGGPGPVPVRSEHTAVYDSTSDRMLVVGGTLVEGGVPQAGSRIWGLELSPTLAWTLLPATGAPPCCFRPAGVFDPSRNAILLPSTVSEDVWMLSLAEVLAWSPVGALVYPAGNPPVVALDPLRDRLLFVRRPSAPDDEVQLDLATGLTSLLATRVPVRPVVDVSSGGVFGYRPDRALLVASEESGRTWLLDSASNLWELDASGRDWTLVPTDPPLDPNRNLALWIDPATSDFRLLAFGSRLFRRAANAAAWTEEVVTDTLPPVRYNTSFAFDAARNRLVIHGGQMLPDYMNVTHPLHDAWSLDLAATPAWTRLPDSPGPVFTYGIQDPLRNRLLVFGAPSQFAALDLGTDQWTLTPTSGGGPPVDLGSAYPPLALDSQRDRLLFGTPPLWELSLATPATWSALDPSGEALPGGVLQPAVYEPSRDRMLTVGLTGSSVWWSDVPAPGLELPEPDSVATGAGTRVTFGVTDATGGRTAYEYLVTCSRAWGGFPLGSSLRVDANTTGLATFTVSVPESAASGPVDLTVDVRLVNEPRLLARGSVRLEVRDDAGGPVGPDAAGPSLRVRPNPAGSSVDALVHLATDGPAVLLLYDIRGRHLWTRDLGAPGRGDHAIPLDLGRLQAAGVYVLEIRADGKADRQRIVHFR